MNMEKTVKKVLVLVLDNKQYFYELISRDVNMHSVYRELKPLEKLFLNKRGRFYNLVPFFLGKWVEELNNAEHIIVFDSAYTTDVGKYIKHHAPKCKLILYFYNPILAKYQKSYLSDKYIDEIWSFDRFNAEEYGLKFNSTFYSFKVLKTIHKKKKEHDVVYIGRDKSRDAVLIEIEEALKRSKCSYWFHVVKKESDYLNYNEYLSFVLSSKCILDITQRGQSGLTMRSMESLFFEKKLITNNMDIANYDFYNPNNVFIIGIDDYTNLHSFLCTPYNQVRKDIISKYDVMEWAKRFVDENNDKNSIE